VPRRAAALCLLLALPAGADLAPEEWEEARAEAARLARKPGEAARKARLVERVAREDSARAASVLLELAGPAGGRRTTLDVRLRAAVDAFARLDRELRRKEREPAAVAANARWRARRATVVDLRAQIDEETAVLAAIGRAFAGFRSPGTVAALLAGGDAAHAPEARTGLLEALLAQPPGRFDEALVPFARDAELPLARVKALDAIAARRIGAGLEAASEGVKAQEPVVARAAVAALKALDDPRAVPALVAARASASGLLAHEIERALRYFTGRNFAGAGADAMWAEWWRREGEAWLAAAGSERFPEGEEGGAGGAEFYGIPTRSNRIVFVLDRSDSMRLPVPQHAPVSGATRDGRTTGATKLEVAQAELARTIRGLPADARFGLVFYGAHVKAWREPPRLEPATAASRETATAWLAALRPEGCTLTFAALAEALRYAEGPGGADTIFLLSDGAPTNANGDPLTSAETDAALAAFLEANRAFRCVVHAIGVGPDHNRDLMTRLARETGGTYKAVADR
jgi:hypothetical protein